MEKESLIKSSLVYVIFSGLNKAVPFLLLPIITEYITPEEYGYITLFLLFVAIISPLISIGYRGALQRYYYKLPYENLKKFVSNGLIVIFLLSVLVFFGTLIFATNIVDLFKLSFSWIILAVIVSLFYSLSEVVFVLFQNSNKPFQFGGLEFIRTIVNVSISVYLIVEYKIWEGRIIGYSCSIIFVGFFAIFYLWKLRLLTLNQEESYYKSILKFGLPTIPHTISGMVIFMSDRLFISEMVGLKQTGLYSIGFQIAQIVLITQDAMIKAWTPWLFSKLSIGQINKNSLMKYIYLLLSIIVGLVLTLNLISPFIFKYFVDSKYSLSISFVIYISIGFAFNGFYKVISSFIFYHEKTNLLPFITISSALINLILNYVLISSYGAIGASIATMLSFFYCFVLAAIINQKIFPLPWFSFIRNK